jgi:hypothetical protein
VLGLRMLKIGVRRERHQFEGAPQLLCVGVLVALAVVAAPPVVIV